MNKGKQNVKNIFSSLIEDRGTFNERFSDNMGVRQGGSYEAFLNRKLTDAGLKDFSYEMFDLRDSNVLEFELFGSFETKRAKYNYFRWLKDSLEDNAIEVIKTFKVKQGFIEQPLSSKRQPDIFIWWHDENNNARFLLVDVKTGGGRGPKVNDREIGWNHLVIFNSRHKSVVGRPTTITFARDLFTKIEYDDIAKERQQFEEMKKELIERQKHHKYIRFNPRARVEILSSAGNWFGTINDKSREDREQLALDYIWNLS